jgi:DNA-binding beta-propeller fold protein YncE
MAVDPDGNVYVADDVSDTLTIYNSSGVLTRTIRTAINGLSGVTVH